MILISAYVSRGTGRWHPHLESRWNLQQKLRWWGRQSIQIPSSSPKCRRKQTPRIRRSDRAWRENQHASCAAKLHSNMALHLEPAENIQDEVQLSTWRANWVKNCHHVHGFYLLSPFHEFGLAFKNSRTCIYIYTVHICMYNNYVRNICIYIYGRISYIYIYIYIKSIFWVWFANFQHAEKQVPSKLLLTTASQNAAVAGGVHWFSVHRVRLLQVHQAVWWLWPETCKYKW